MGDTREEADARGGHFKTVADDVPEKAEGETEKMYESVFKNRSPRHDLRKIKGVKKKFRKPDKKERKKND